MVRRHEILGDTHPVTRRESKGKGLATVSASLCGWVWGGTRAAESGKERLSDFWAEPAWPRQGPQVQRDSRQLLPAPALGLQPRVSVCSAGLPESLTVTGS